MVPYQMHYIIDLQPTSAHATALSATTHDATLERSTSMRIYSLLAFTSVLPHEGSYRGTEAPRLRPLSS